MTTSVTHTPASTSPKITLTPSPEASVTPATERAASMGAVVAVREYLKIYEAQTARFKETNNFFTEAEFEKRVTDANAEIYRVLRENGSSIGERSEDAGRDRARLEDYFRHNGYIFAPSWESRGDTMYFTGVIGHVKERQLFDTAQLRQPNIAFSKYPIVPVHRVDTILLDRYESQPGVALGYGGPVGGTTVKPESGPYEIVVFDQNQEKGAEALGVSKEDAAKNFIVNEAAHVLLHENIPLRWDSEVVTASDGAVINFNKLGEAFSDYCSIAFSPSTFPGDLRRILKTKQPSYQFSRQLVLNSFQEMQKAERGVFPQNPPPTLDPKSATLNLKDFQKYLQATPTAAERARQITLKEYEKLAGVINSLVREYGHLKPQ